MIIIWTNDVCHQEKILSETDLTQEFAIKAGQTSEATRQVGLLQREAKEVNFKKSEKQQQQQKTVTSRWKKAWGNSLSQKAELLSPIEKK